MVTFLLTLLVILTFPVWIGPVLVCGYLAFVALVLAIKLLILGLFWPFEYLSRVRRQRRHFKRMMRD